MGLLDWLSGGQKSNCTVESDAIWMSKRAKALGWIKEVELQGQTAPVLVVCHFPGSLEEVKGVFEIAGIKFDIQDRIWDHDQSMQLISSPPGTVTVTLTEFLATSNFEAVNVDDTKSLSILAAERHALEAEDNRIIEFAESLPCRTRVRFMLSLEEPLLKIFVGEEVTNLLRQMGMEEDECFDNNLVSRRINAAQKKIAESSTGNSRTHTAEEWFAKNMPSSIS